jgi:hypothetical protein
MSVSTKKRAVVFVALFLLTLALLGVTVYKIAHKSDEQHAKYLVVKEEYIRTHSGQGMILFPWEPTSAKKIFPFNYSIPATPGNNMSIQACPGQYEAASFAITAQQDLSEITITVPNLYDEQNNIIPADEVDVSLVKVWYQSGENSIVNQGVRVLSPELLLKDDSLVIVDYVNKINYIRIIIDGSQRYTDISDADGKIPANAWINDSIVLQPFSLKKNENKQIWMTVHVPDNSTPGEYYGNITITTSSTSPVFMNLSITVLPFSLEQSPLEYSLYYRGTLNITPFTEIDSENKTPAQYEIELQDMKKHGVLYPTLYQNDNSMLDSALKLRANSGLPTDHIYIAQHIGNASGNDTGGQTIVEHKVRTWTNHTLAYGYTETYLYGMDEANGDILFTERPAWQTVHNAGGKVFVASYTANELIDTVGDILDLAVLGSKINATQAVLWHAYGHKVFLYNQPQVGIENPDIYRKNYGYILWNAGYDGSMDYAYQHSFGNIWNDFDDPHFRDTVFAYPTSDGVINTVQWEGFREGVDDTRFLASLKKKEGNFSSGRTIVASSLAAGDTMPGIRKKIIERILS